MLRRHIFLALFFLLWAGNCVLSHAIAREYVLRAQAHPTQPAPDQTTAPAQGRGGVLLVTNFPLFIGLGFMVRAADPGFGALYWALAVVGSVYIPFFATLFSFLLFTPPRPGSSLPGVDWENGTIEDDEDD